VGEFLKVLNFREALQKIKSCFPGRQAEKVCLAEACNRILAAEIISPEHLPAFNRSTVDGYAVNAGDTFGSSEALPAYLNLAGEVKMGMGADFRLDSGQCCWIPTGGMLPEGADSVVMVEYTEKLGKDTVLVFRPVGPGENVMQKGEDVTEGEVILKPGKLLRPQDIGFLASLGILETDVFKPFSIGIISTGDEVIPIDRKPLTGQVRDVNSYSLAAAVQSLGSIPQVYPIVKDEFNALKQSVDSALGENDLVLLSGGSSVGIMDVTLDVLLSFSNAELLFHGLAVKPGKPTMAVRVGDKLVIGLPGHPVSALMMFYIICAPVLRFAPLLWVDVRVSVNIASQAGRDDFVPVQLVEEDGGQTARPLLGKSGLLNILSQADAYIHIPGEKQGLKAGEKVKAYIF